MSTSYEWTCAEEHASLLVEIEALADENRSLREAMQLILSEYHEIRSKHRKLVERTGHVDLK
jgi:hypothetical protein